MAKGYQTFAVIVKDKPYMIPTISASKIYSTLGNSNSLVPLAIKDVANSIGLTTASYITGDEA